MDQRIPIGGLLAIVVAAAVVSAPRSADAIDPFGARYMADADEMLWFLQISDSHVGENLLFGTQDTDNLDYVVGEVVDTILPEFVVLTGDIVDASNGWLWPTWQYQEEWDEYRGVTDAWGMDITFFHDVSGNHDTYTDAGATYYLGNSITGQAFGTWHEAWTHSFPWGEYLFVGLNTADVGGSLPGLESEGLTQDELGFLEDSLIAYGAANLAFVFTHHPLSYFDYGESETETLLTDHQVSVWANGHAHEYYVDFENATLYFNLDSLGRSGSHNLGVFAVDHDGVAARGVDIGVWPVVLTTAPTDTSLGGTNPYAYPVSGGQVDNPVRALVFDPDGVLAVEFEVDGGTGVPMAEVAPSVWQGDWDCTVETPGLHELTVWAVSLSGTESHTIEVEVAITECDDGADNDGNGYVDYPDDGGCWSPSDDSEAGWSGDDDDSAGDDDDSAMPDDDSAGDDDSAMPDDDDTTDDDDDDDTAADDDTTEDGPDDDTLVDDDTEDGAPMNTNPGQIGGGCECANNEQRGRVGAAVAFLALLFASRRRTARR